MLQETLGGPGSGSNSSEVDKDENAGADDEEDAGVGKPLYASPEQWESIGVVGVKADF